MAQAGSEHGGGYWIYVRTWAWLLAITVVEVGVVLVHAPRVVLIGGLVVMAVLKAMLIISIFMHLRFERIQFAYTVLVPLGLIMVLFFGVVPDAFRLRERGAAVPTLEEMEAAARASQPQAERPKTGGPAVAVAAQEFKFTPAQIEVKAGQVTFQIHNGGVIPHSFRITDLGNVGTDPINGGATGQFTASIPAGSHTFICDVPGHAQAGMHGVIVAKP